ncbi:HNH endonuclease [Leptothoe spongobia]|uniref:HNH endonuclease n=1 Tax=Leptothoe spongobia TAU-MAC 1115 TaxID=1967444 RepID=A0A947GL91_9CYAN|nr:HNH endonuclease signature motif containing protein [Leptothoe spongobia]MBT9317308.1 HNH endonuclease [Leptothoe spongobia TAU-MAC 1115]
MAYIPDSLRRAVSKRAEGKCEYCQIHQTFSIYTHEIDHAVAIKHGGQTNTDNLVLACLPCNRHKGSDLTSIDPFTGEITPLFNPRINTWSKHFELQDAYILGLTAIGRTTIFLLKFNDANRLQRRQLLISQGLYPDLPTIT